METIITTIIFKEVWQVILAVIIIKMLLHNFILIGKQEEKTSALTGKLT